MREGGVYIKSKKGTAVFSKTDNRVGAPSKLVCSYLGGLKRTAGIWLRD